MRLREGYLHDRSVGDGANGARLGAFEQLDDPHINPSVAAFGRLRRPNDRFSLASAPQQPGPEPTSRLIVVRNLDLVPKLWRHAASIDPYATLSVNVWRDAHHTHVRSPLPRLPFAGSATTQGRRRVQNRCYESSRPHRVLSDTARSGNPSPPPRVRSAQRCVPGSGAAAVRRRPD